MALDGMLKRAGIGLAGIALAAGLAVGSANAAEYNANGYNHLIPDLSGLVPYKTFHVDGTDKIPGKETLIERFKQANGNVVARLSIDGKVFAYSVAGSTEKDSYSIRDGIGDEVFREKYEYKERFNVPEWLIDKKLVKKID